MSIRWIFAREIENIVLQLHRSVVGMHRTPYMRNAFLDVERIVVHMCVPPITCRIKRSHIFILADIITERIVH